MIRVFFAAAGRVRGTAVWKAIAGGCFFLLGVMLLTGRLPCRLHLVLTGSMEPAIPANSLVVTRRYDPGMPLQKGEIIAFSAQRFGESVVVLHRFSHTETTPTGRTLYRTHPEKSTLLDSYEVTQEEILGVYLFHIPRLGRLSLFLKSPFGLLWGCEMVLILLANSWIRIRSNPV